MSNTAHISLFSLVSFQARRDPDAGALVVAGRPPLTYGRLATQLDATLEILTDAGVGRRDCVVLALPNGAEMAAAVVATAACTTRVPINPEYRAAECAGLFELLNPRALMVQAGVRSGARAAAEKHGLPIIELSSVVGAEAGVFELDARSKALGEGGATGFAAPDDVALILPTSGTTARPKVVPLTHRNVCASAHAIQEALGLSETDRCLNLMPLFHVHGLIGATLSSLSSGGSVVCVPGFDVGMFFRCLQELCPTWYTAVPTMHRAILERAEDHWDAIESVPLRFIRSSSAALPPQTMVALEEVFTAPVIESYGMTEAHTGVVRNHCTATFRPTPGTHPSGFITPARERTAPAAPCGPSHRIRCVVREDLHQATGCSVRSVFKRPPLFSPRNFRAPISRLRFLGATNPRPRGL